MALVHNDHIKLSNARRWSARVRDKGGGELALSEPERAVGHYSSSSPPSIYGLEIGAAVWLSCAYPAQRAFRIGSNLTISMVRAGIVGLPPHIGKLRKVLGELVLEVLAWSEHQKPSLVSEEMRGEVDERFTPAARGVQHGKAGERVG
jgi:hypothetical protein